jgi:predicted  nucleic acid-binding Zn-ribbon protein
MARLDEVRAELRQAESKKRRLENRLLGWYRRMDKLQCEDERLTSSIDEYSELRRSNSREMGLVLESQRMLENKLRHLQRVIRMYVLLPNLRA